MVLCANTPLEGHSLEVLLRDFISWVLSIFKGIILNLSMTMHPFFERVYATISSPVFLCCSIHGTEDVVWSCCWVAFQGSVEQHSAFTIPGPGHEKQLTLVHKADPLLLLSFSASFQWNFISPCFLHSSEGGMGYSAEWRKLWEEQYCEGLGH